METKSFKSQDNHVITRVKALEAEELHLNTSFNLLFQIKNTVFLY
jgi:hypothetical protein